MNHLVALGLADVCKELCKPGLINIERLPALNALKLDCPKQVALPLVVTNDSALAA